jgi:hypothetical protein
MSYIIYGSTINGIIATGSQILRLSTSSGVIKLTLYYRPAIQMWFIDIDYNEKYINGIRICLSNNILRQWRKSLGFGILIDSNDLKEPMQIDDFSSGRVTMLLLSSDEVDTIESYYSSGI